MGWSCDVCHRMFTHSHQKHYCGDFSITEFLSGKPAVAELLFDAFMLNMQEIGPFQAYAGKSMVMLKNKKNFAQIIYFGKQFIDVVFQFKESFDDNLCFRKIALVPGTTDFNHHLRLMHPDDLNEEVIGYLKKAYQVGEDL